MTTETDASTRAPWKDEETLRDLYVDQELSQKEVAERLGCSPMNISYWLRRHEIPTRNPNEHLGDDRPWQDEGYLRDIYEKKDREIASVAEELGCSSATIRNWLDKHGIPRSADAKKHDPTFDDEPPWRDADRLREAVESGMSQSDMAEAWDTTQPTVSRWMKKFGVEPNEAGD